MQKPGASRQRSATLACSPSATSRLTASVASAEALSSASIRRGSLTMRRQALSSSPMEARVWNGWRGG